MSDFLFTKYPLEHFLIMSTFVFCCGIYTVITHKNAISILMGVELILNAANINFIAFYRFTGANFSGIIFVLFVIALAAVEASVALAIIIGIYRNFGDIDVDEVNEMKE